jgi:hypothetical protein
MPRLVLLILVGFGCNDSGDDSNGSADDSSTPDDSGPDDTGTPNCDKAFTWSTGAEKFFSTYCTSCHSSELTGAARHNAPPDANFDTYQGVYDDRFYILDLATGFNPSMPRSGPEPTDAEREAIALWIACDLPK